MKWAALIVMAMLAAGQRQAPPSGPGGQPLLAAAVRLSLDLAERGEPETLADQVRFCEMPAPPFEEKGRAEVVRQAFVRLGLRDVHVDRAGNVIGDRAGKLVHPHVVLAAHLDTVFPPSTPVRVTRAGPTLTGPGIGDNCRGLAVLVAVARAMRAANVETAGTVTFLANVGEEGLGDLRGVREFFGVAKAGSTARTDVDAFVSIDGPGLFVVNRSVGSRRYRVTFKGPGGHSYASFGTASPIGALGRAVARINDIRMPATPRTTYNVGRIGGGTSVNAIPAEAWMEIDVRGAEASALEALDERVQRAIDQGVLDENARWGRARVISVERERVGVRPVGSLPETSAIVVAARRAAETLGIDAGLSEGSTDANLPMSLGIPAITIGGGGEGANAHATSESFDSTNAWKGTQHALLLVLTLAERTP